MSNNISKFFTWEEFLWLPKWNRMATEDDGLDDVVKFNIKRLVFGVLEPLRAILGQPMDIVSGFRPEEYNKLIGGAPLSTHKSGAAADFYVKEIPSEEVRNTIIPFCGMYGFRVELGTPHVHVDIRRPYGSFKP